MELPDTGSILGAFFDSWWRIPLVAIVAAIYQLICSSNYCVVILSMLHELGGHINVGRATDSHCYATVCHRNIVIRCAYHWDGLGIGPTNMGVQ